MTYLCGHCHHDLRACACTAESMALDAARGAPVMCENCGQAPAFGGWDDCLACGCAYLIHEDRAGIDFQRRVLAMQPLELRRFNTELQRQMSALVDAGRAIA